MRRYSLTAVMMTHDIHNRTIAFNKFIASALSLQWYAFSMTFKIMIITTYYLNMFKRRPPKPAPSPRKKARKGRVVALTPEQRLEEINKDIARIELEIKKQASRFEVIRAEMMTGIVSHNGVTAKSASEQLTNILTTLQQERTQALAESDRFVNISIIIYAYNNNIGVLLRRQSY